MAQDARAALQEGLVDAAAFVGGAIGGWQVGRWFGVDALDSSADTSTLIGLAFVIGGCGLGKFASLHWRRYRATPRG